MKIDTTWTDVQYFHGYYFHKTTNHIITNSISDENFSYRNSLVLQSPQEKWYLKRYPFHSYIFKILNYDLFAPYIFPSKPHYKLTRGCQHPPSLVLYLFVYYTLNIINHIIINLFTKILLQHVYLSSISFTQYIYLFNLIIFISVNWYVKVECTHLCLVIKPHNGMTYYWFPPYLLIKNISSL